MRRGHITHGVRDDDTDYTVVGLRLLEEHGKDVTSEQIARFWLKNIPYGKTYTAERAAYRNFVNDIWPSRSARWHNPHREWIGAQIRADAWGYCCPGRLQAGAELAFRDASISHTRNGIYGAMWVAAMIAAAYVADDPEQVISLGLSEIPGQCRLAEAINRVLSWYRDGVGAEEATGRLLDAFGDYHAVHSINNAAVVALGLLWGEGDFSRSIGLAVMAGLDTDCNGATVGSVAGVLLGESGLPARWVDPLNDRLETAVAGDASVRISDLAARTLPFQAESIGH
mgnify:CR=1 FL=1